MRSSSSSNINKISTSFLLPYLICFSLYIQIFGEVSPGGGFQAGSLFATCLIGYDISVADIKMMISPNLLARIGATGILIYWFVGFFGLIFGRKFFDYDAFLFIVSQEYAHILGIIIIEFGVGIAVSSTIFLIYRELYAK
ncbi:MAG: MnhB domain-containing protein [Rickettsiaceae bacterium]|nr:MnhB domain-containing protein [Rickettsiaceae bacterium]